MKSDVRTTRCTAMAIGAALALFLFAAAAPAGASSEPITISVLSGRADLVSGGDALVRIGGVSSTQGLKVTVGGTDHTSAFAKRADGTVVGLVRGLKLGRSTIIARAGDRAAQLTVTNHPNGGPVFSGPQLKPWKCQATATDAQCNQPRDVQLRLQVDRPEQVRLPALRPGQPAVGRRDDHDRQGHDGAVHRAHRDRLPRPRPVPDRRPLPARQAVERPWRRSAQFNHKLLITHGATCGVDHQTGTAPAVTDSARRERALGRGLRDDVARARQRRATTATSRPRPSR